MVKRAGWAAVGVIVVGGLALYIAGLVLVPPVAAGALLHPMRRHVVDRPPTGCERASFQGDGVTLEGWRCVATGEARATLVFLHGVGDNRASAAGIVGEFTSKGLNVVAYDSRAHGNSGGDVCTYGYWEKRDLRRVLDTLGGGRVVLLGTSMGAAVALQEAADDSRVVGIVAAEVFSDLRTVAGERAPRFLTQAMIAKAFAAAEARGRFQVDAVSPVNAARRIHVPVLLIHGGEDTDTPPEHSRRVFAALRGPKQLLLIAGAHHNQSLSAPQTWRRIEEWVDGVLRPVTQ